MTDVHKPVLLKEVVDLLSPSLKSGGILVDATLGAGGHTLGLASELKPKDKIIIIGIDQDKEILEIAKETLKEYKNEIVFVNDNFYNIKEILLDSKIEKVNAVLADLGISSLQIDSGKRGFSFKKDAPLDMRMDTGNDLSAELIIKTWNEKKIATILWQYGEERFANKIAKAICANRKDINSTTQLAEIIEKVIPPRYRRGRIHPATQTFQALRIAVNDEIGVLKHFLETAPNLLGKGGRLAVISFHSLEDRLVKQKFNELATNGDFKIITKHPIIGSEDEVIQNPRSRSAKLRVIEKI